MPHKVFSSGAMQLSGIKHPEPVGCMVSINYKVTIILKVFFQADAEHIQTFLIVPP